MEIIDCDQGTEEWKRARLGLPTASEFSTIMASGRNAGESVTRKKYMLQLAGEIITGEPAPDTFSSAHLERGKIMEDEAREYYAFVRSVQVTRVGFIRNGIKGCSPDSLVGTDGANEIKSALPHILGALLLQETFPAEHKPQCQGVLWVAERQWIDLVVYWPKMPTLIRRAYRDEEYIKKMSDAVDVFHAELQQTVERLRSML